MKKRIESLSLIGCLCLSLTLPAGAATSEIEAYRIQQMKTLFSPTPQGLEGFFSRDFIESFQPAKILADYYTELGPCQKVKPQKDGSVAFYFRKGKIPTWVSFDAKPPHRIANLWFGKTVPLAENYGQVIAEMKRMPGNLSFCLKKLGNEKPIAQLNQDSQLAVASSFKLYVLGALVDEIAAGKHRWNETVPLRDIHRSLPSGILQDWPAGAPLTLYSLASLMISQSDNTATDHLISSLGRERIELQMKRMGHSSVNKNTPLLSTAEMFKLKDASHPKLLNDYLAKDSKGRRSYLSRQLAPMDLDSSDIPKHPHRVESAEWFASASDLCRAMEWLSRKGPTVRSILAINPGLDPLKRYAGYKGGSEPGVLSMTYLIQGANNAFYAVSLTWNDPKEPLDEERFFLLAQQILELI